MTGRYFHKHTVFVKGQFVKFCPLTIALCNGVGDGNGRQQRLGIGMLGVGIKLCGRCQFYKSNIEALGGDVEVKTKLGEGSTFTVRLPLTLAIIQALLVKVREELYAIALGSITSIEDVPVSDIKYVEAKEVIHLRDTVIPLVRLDRVLDVEPKEDPEHLTVVIVKRGDQQAGLVVDDLIGQQEIVIKSLGKYMTGNKLISGATILGDGEVALIIDANTLM